MPETPNTNPPANTNPAPTGGTPGAAHPPATVSLAVADRFVHRSERKILRVLLAGTGIGLLCIIGYSWIWRCFSSSLLTVSILTALAVLVSGFFLGNLFGMPKRNNDVGTDYTLNNSLAEIADWLTKIIVGLGLVELRQVPGYLRRMSEFFYAASDAAVQPEYIKVYAIVLVVYFGVLGLFLGYNYIRLVLSYRYKLADSYVQDQVVAIIQENQQLKSENLKTSDALKTVINDKKKSEWYTYEAASKLIGGADRGGMEPNPQQQALDELWNLANAIYGKRTSKADPQKGLWGGQAEVNGFRLSAQVQEISQGAYEISLSVQGGNSLTDGNLVLFALHDSFGNPPFRLVMAENGEAETRLFSYGSFTVGAALLYDAKLVTLEVNLAELPGVSEYFKTH